MQCQNLRCNDFANDERNSGLGFSTDAGMTTPVETDLSVLRQLVKASKEAEGLIACLFELHLIAAAPLERAWDRFARAITTAQRRLRRQDQASAIRVMRREF